MPNDANAPAPADQPLPEPNAVDQPPAEPAPTEAAASEAEMLGRLQEENARLKARIDELQADADEREEVARRLEEAQEAQSALRRKVEELSLSRALREAAADLGISAEAAETLRGRFTCEVDDSGEVRIAPAPSELLSERLAGDPLLRESASRGRERRAVSAVVTGAAGVDGADPVELMGALDRSPKRKARFIARHGAQAYVDLAESARRKGYRE